MSEYIGFTTVFEILRCCGNLWDAFYNFDFLEYSKMDG